MQKQQRERGMREPTSQKSLKKRKEKKKRKENEWPAKKANEREKSVYSV